VNLFPKAFLKTVHHTKDPYISQNTDLTALYNFYFRHFSMQQTNKTHGKIIPDYEVLRHICIRNPTEQTAGIHLVLFLLEQMHS
jgi:hypothetical protein